MNIPQVKHKGSRTCLVLLLMMAGALPAAVVDYRDEVRKAPDLIHHYTFEGRQQSLVAPRLVDRAGVADLAEQSINSTGYPLPYVPGCDLLSTAGKSNGTPGSYVKGRAWVTTNAIALPSTMTVECIMRIDELPGVGTEGGLITTRAASNDRGYYLWVLPDGRLIIRIGTTDAWTLLQSVNLGSWYYVASTFTHNGNITTINSYYADLNADGPLTHVLEDKVSNGTYGSSAVLGIGVLRQNNSDLQYFSACSMDEVAIYNTAHELPAISNRWEALRMEVPTVEYREIFPNDTNTVARSMPCEGWQAHYGTNAVSSSVTWNAVVQEKAATAFDEDLPAVASFPTDTGVVDGYLNNHSGPTNVNYLYWTDEMTNRLDVSWIKLAMFDSRVDENRVMRLALRVDTNATPDEVEDDVWFIGADFDNPSGTSAIPIPTAAWRRYWVDLGENEWTTFDFVPGSRSYLGDAKVALPTNGVVTAFGLFQDHHNRTRNMRIDNFTLYARRIYPLPPPRGTMIIVQ